MKKISIFFAMSLCAALFVSAVGVGKAEAQATTTTLVISAIDATSTASGTSAVISWVTNQPATSRVVYGVNVFYGASTTLNQNLATGHSVQIFGLIPDTTYHFFVESANASGTMATSSDQVFATVSGSTSATTTLPSGTSTPIISSILASSTGSTSEMITWTTDQPSTSQVVYGINVFYGASTTPDATLITNHSVELFGLIPDTTYHFFVESANASGTMATSSDQIFVSSATSTATTTATSTQATSTPSTPQSTSGPMGSRSGGHYRVVGSTMGGSSEIFTINISQGTRSVYVLLLQLKLKVLGYFSYPTATGYFGPLTRTSVQAFQAAHGIPATGFVGPLTRAELNR